MESLDIVFYLFLLSNEWKFNGNKEIMDFIIPTMTKMFFSSFITYLHYILVI